MDTAPAMAKRGIMLNRKPRSRRSLGDKIFDRRSSVAGCIFYSIGFWVYLKLRGQITEPVAQLFDEIISNDELDEFLTLRAYAHLD